MVWAWPFSNGQYRRAAARSRVCFSLQTWSLPCLHSSVSAKCPVAHPWHPHRFPNNSGRCGATCRASQETRMSARLFPYSTIDTIESAKRNKKKWLFAYSLLLGPQNKQIAWKKPRRYQKKWMPREENTSFCTRNFYSTILSHVM